MGLPLPRPLPCPPLPPTAPNTDPYPVLAFSISIPSSWTFIAFVSVVLALITVSIVLTISSTARTLSDCTTSVSVLVTVPAAPADAAEKTGRVPSNFPRTLTSISFLAAAATTESGFTFPSTTVAVLFFRTSTEVVFKAVPDADTAGIGNTDVLLFSNCVLLLSPMGLIS